MRITAKFESRAPTTPAKATSGNASHAAKNLALAYKIAGLIDRGLLLDFSSAARALGISQPRVTHVMGLLLLAPEIQEAILLGELAFGDKELRALARIADWEEQKAAVAARTASPRRRNIARASLRRSSSNRAELRREFSSTPSLWLLGYEPGTLL